MENVFVKPAQIARDGDGEPLFALVRDPVTLEPLSIEGEWKPRSPFWTRRLRDRDVIEGEPPVEASPAPAKAPKPSAKPAA